jgi:hypothetical protein
MTLRNWIGTANDVRVQRGSWSDCPPWTVCLSLSMNYGWLSAILGNGSTLYHAHVWRL